MARIGWRFPPLSGGTVQGYTNNDIEAFKGEMLIDNLTREICQNSLDAKLQNTDAPVKVVFELKYVSSNYQVFQDYAKHISACCDYYADHSDERVTLFLNDAKEMLNREKIPVLIVGDYETTGLKGSNPKGARDISSPWEALTGADGVSVKSSDTSGGSFGIGKNAPFACSALSMVFYNTFDVDEVKAFIGVGRLATHEINRIETQRTGKYQYNEEEKSVWKPIFPNHKDKFRDIFERTEYGTDVIIAGFNQEMDWCDNVTRAILKNFFVAIYEQKLIVKLIDGDHSILIDKGNISQLIEDYSVDGSNDMLITSQLYKAFTNGERFELDILDGSNELDAEVYLLLDSSFKRNIAHFRDTGMLIFTKRRVMRQQFAAVFIVRGEKLGELLRATEPARHNLWDYKLITANSEKDKRFLAKKALDRIKKQIDELITSNDNTVLSDSIDAVGISEYLPAFDTNEAEGQGTDILRPKIKLSGVKTVKERRPTVRVKGRKSKGRKIEGQYGNDTQHPRPTATNIKPVVNPKEGNEDGASQGKGTKKIRKARMKGQRAFPMSAQNGVYKIVLVPDEDYQNLYIQCSAYGENGSKDELDLLSFKKDRQDIDVNNNIAGPIQIKADEPVTFYATLASQDKLVLDLNITEVS